MLDLPNLKTMHPEIDFLKLQIAEYMWPGRHNRLAPVPNFYPADGSTLSNLEVIASLFKQEKPKQSLEIGLSRGISGLLFCKLYESIGAKPAKQHMALDPFQDEDFDQAGVMLIERGGVDGYFNYRTEFSSDGLPKLFAEGKRFDLIYIDGSHLMEDVFIDFFYSYQLLNKGGIMLFDDCADKHVLKVCRFIEAQYTEKLEVLDIAALKGRTGIDNLK